MLKRLKYLIFYNKNKFTKKLLLFTILCEFLSFSFSFKQFVKKYNSEIQKDTNYQISIISPLNVRDYLFNNCDDYQEEINEYINYANNIASSESISFDYVTNYKCPVVSIDGNYHLESLNGFELDGTMNSFLNDIYIKGVSSNNFPDLILDKIKIIEGESSFDDKTCIVSNKHQLIDADGNIKKINIGDYIPISILKVCDDNRYVICQTDYYKVIGIYSPVNNNTLTRFSNKNYGEFSPIYLRADNLLNLLDNSYSIQSEYHNKDVILSTLEIEPILLSFDDKDVFLNTISKIENSQFYKENKITYKTSIDDSIAWISINDSFVEMLNILSNIFIFIIPFMIVLCLILNYFYDLKEMMIYVSLGQDKKEVLLLFQIYNFIILLIGILICYLSIYLFNNYCAQKEFVYNFNFDRKVILFVVVALVLSTVFEYNHFKNYDFKDVLR